MKKVLLTLLAVVVVLGVLAGAGIAGYQYGYLQAASGDNAPFLRGNGFGWNRMPMHQFGWGMGPGFHHGFGGFGMMGGWGFFGPLYFLLQIAVVVFIVWLVYKIFTGWRITLTRPGQETPKSPAETEANTG